MHETHLGPLANVCHPFLIDIWETGRINLCFRLQEGTGLLKYTVISNPNLAEVPRCQQVYV